MKKGIVLKKVIQKAIDGGFDGVEGRAWIHSLDLGVKVNVQHIIFDHSFAKAFWGEEKWCFVTGYDEWCEVKSAPPEGMAEQRLLIMPAWQYHLTQLVLAKDRLAYLEGFL